jgi:hypothetical protein
MQLISFHTKSIKWLTIVIQKPKLYCQKLWPNTMFLKVSSFTNFARDTYLNILFRCRVVYQLTYYHDLKAKIMISKAATKYSFSVLNHLFLPPTLLNDLPLWFQRQSCIARNGSWILHLCFWANFILYNWCKGHWPKTFYLEVE